MIFLLGLLIAAGASWVAIRWLGPRGWMDFPGPRKHHPLPCPRTGGLALWATLGFGVATGLWQVPITPLEWLALHGLALMGALDDRFGLRARTKALGGLGLAFALALSTTQMFANDRPVVMLAGLTIPTDPPLLIFLLLLLWFWAIPQSFNLIDGMDGLASGLALLIALSLQLEVRQGFLSFHAGAIVAILVFNWPRARHFLGDCGAYFLGGFLALLVLKTRAFTYPSLALWTFAYPILDTTLVIIIRLVRRRPLGEGDRNHFHHHLGDWLGARSGLTVPLLLLQAVPLMVGPLAFPGSGWVAWGALVVVGGEGMFFAWRVQRSRGCPPAAGA